MQFMWTQILIVLPLLALAVEAITEILVAGVIFDFVRVWLHNIYIPPVPGVRNPLMDKIAEISPWTAAAFDAVTQWTAPIVYQVWTCGYCMSVWIAALISLIVGRNLITLDSDWHGVVAWALMTFILHRLANWLHVLYELKKRGRVDTKDVDLKIGKLEVTLTPTTTPAPTLLDDWTSGKISDLMATNDLARRACKAAVALDNIRLGKPLEQAPLSEICSWLKENQTEGDLLLLYRAISEHDKGANMMTLSDVKKKAAELSETISKVAVGEASDIAVLRDTCMAISGLALATPQRLRQF